MLPALGNRDLGTELTLKLVLGLPNVDRLALPLMLILLFDGPVHLGNDLFQLPNRQILLHRPVSQLGQLPLILQS